jgi:Derlin-2/3
MYFFEVQNSYVPYAFLLLNLFSGKSIIENIIGIIAGNVYYFLKEIAPIQKGVDILVTPKFIVDFSDKYIDREFNNRNAFGNSGVYNRGDRYYDRYRRSHED